MKEESVIQQIAREHAGDFKAQVGLLKRSVKEAMAERDELRKRSSVLDAAIDGLLGALEFAIAQCPPIPPEAPPP